MGGVKKSNEALRISYYMIYRIQRVMCKIWRKIVYTSAVNWETGSELKRVGRIRNIFT